MSVKFFRALWGLEQLPSTEAKFRQIKEAGFSGVESVLPQEDPAEWKALLEAHDLEFVGLIFGDTVEQFSEQFARIKAYGPQLIASQSGRDKMTFREGCDFFLKALSVEREHGIPVAHETHRGRLLYAPWVTEQYLEEFPNLQLCADFSHWCVVCESLLDDMRATVLTACEHTLHIHTRVGYSQGPQVPDPRAPEYGPVLECHESWWDEIVNLRKATGSGATTVTPEFGPPPYMHTLPFTNQPVADTWDISVWMADRLRKRWEA